MKRRDENAFLPAALEIQESPPSPIGRAIIWLILIFFVATLIWATFGKTDIVAVAQGRIIPSGHSKIVQPLEIGTVRHIHVTEGQAVKAGDVLIELDPSSARADVTRLQDEQAAAKRQVARFDTLSQWLQREATEDIQANPSKGTSDTAQQGSPDTTDTLLLGQWHEYQDRLAVLDRERDRKTAERHSAQQQVDKLKSILPIVTKRADDQKGLADQKLLPEQQYLETEQERLELYHDLRTQKRRLNELDAALAELQARRAYTRSEFRRQTLEQREEAQRRLSTATQELAKADTRHQAQTITAPVDGTVQQLAVHNVGAIVTPAQELMVIVPKHQQLEVEAVLENKDIGFVEVGQTTEIKIDTFPFTKYGTIHGEVVNLSNDAVVDEQKGLVYKMRVLMARADIEVNGKLVQLTPGMTVTVESKTGKRRMIEFFLSPLLRYASESARER